MISSSFVARDVTVFSDDCREKPACFLKEMNLFTLTPSVMFVNFRLALYCSCQLLWNNPVWLVSSNFLPTLQLTKLHQLAMQHIPLPSLGQSNPTFPGTYPRLPGEVHLSPCLHSSLNHIIKTPLSLQRGSRMSPFSQSLQTLSQVFCRRWLYRDVHITKWLVRFCTSICIYLRHKIRWK